MKQKEMLEGKAALENFARTMKALFRVPKSEVQPPERKPVTRKKQARGR